MNTSFLEIARANRIIALNTLRHRNRALDESADVLCLRRMRQKLQAKPVFVSTRAYQLDERMAA